MIFRPVSDNERDAGVTTDEHSGAPRRTPSHLPAGPRMTFRPGPRLPSRRHTVYRRVPQPAASRVRDVSRIRESFSCQAIPAVATRGGDATTAIVRLFIIAAGLQRDRLVVAWAAPPGTPDVANRRRGVRIRATRGALTRIVAVARHEAPVCGWVVSRRFTSTKFRGLCHPPRRPEIPSSVC